MGSINEMPGWFVNGLAAQRGDEAERRTMRGDPPESEYDVLDAGLAAIRGDKAEDS